MKPDYILKADILDIIFENKNKDYGAYSLRKHYNERLSKSMGIAVLLIGLACVFTFFKKESNDLITAVYNDPIYAAPPLQEPAPAEPPKPKPPVSPNVTPLAAPSNDPKIVHDEGSITFSDDAPKIEAPGAGIITTSVPPGEGGGPAGVFQPAPPADPGTAPVVDRSIPVDKPDIMPSFPGGMEALRKFLQRNLTNPHELEQDETISVKIKFIVGYDGLLKGFEVFEDGGTAFNNEVIRVLKKMPAWIPGKAKGENVSVYYVIPVKFTISD